LVAVRDADREAGLSASAIGPPPVEMALLGECDLYAGGLKSIRSEFPSGMTKKNEARRKRYVEAIGDGDGE
jgi:hypothetical protein